ncbi:MAG TPA: response regulator transcription factor [Actinomycetota bacterium]|nr:response regulator transcription factor [Actinomycetota bacterium]
MTSGAGPGRGGGRSDKCRVVLADDTPEIRTLLRLTLEDQGGIEVVGEAGDGAKAVEIVSELQPDAIVLDLAMPVMDGFEAIPEVRRRSPATKIIVLSGFDESVMCERALSLGADLYFEKGISFFDLAEKVVESCPGRA